MVAASRTYSSVRADFAVPATRPLSEQVSDAIVSMIASEALVAGQRLVETELAAQFRTSRVPVREAVKMLETQGILATTPYRGTYVMEFGEREQARVAEARIALETLIVRQAAEAVRANVRLLEQLDRVLGWMADCVLTGDRAGINRADVEFHRQMCQLTGNAILITLWGAIAHHVLIGFGLSNDRYPDSAAVLAQHRRLREALVSAPIEGLEEIITSHVLGRDVVRPGKPIGNRRRSAGERKGRKA